MERLFDCVICEREVVDYDFRNGRDRHIEPNCRFCEGHYSDKGPGAGAFMDRRMACRLSAIANALLGTANAKDWERRYGRS
jgi:hypothetical protein